jgi:hypothetical protein
LARGEAVGDHGPFAIIVIPAKPRVSEARAGIHGGDGLMDPGSATHHFVLRRARDDN